MQIVHRAYALDGRDLGVVAQLHDLRDAGTGDLAVYNDVAGAAMPLAAAYLAAREQQPLTQYLRKRFVALQHKSALDPVDYQDFLDHAVSSFINENFRKVSLQSARRAKSTL